MPYRCCSCFRIDDNQLARDIYIIDDGMRNGHYYTIYAHGPKYLYCAKCRHRFKAMERLIGIWHRRGYDVLWSPNDVGSNTVRQSGAVARVPR